MIKATHKRLERINEMIAAHRKVLVLGCETCTGICLVGGEKEVARMAANLRLLNRKNGGQKTFSEGVVRRQCEMEFLDGVASLINSADAVVSLACGVGMQAIAEHFPSTPVYPGNNTMFLGLSPELGLFSERCVACGDCLIDRTGGLCPIARCAKHLFNGPCGGSVAGKCEISPDVPCIWQMIYDRLARLGQLSKLEEIKGIRNWKTNDAAGPRAYIREDLRTAPPKLESVTIKPVASKGDALSTPKGGVA